MGFTPIVVFCFCVLGIFGLFMVSMPSDFLILSDTWNPDYIEKDVADYYSQNNVTMFESADQFNLTYPDSHASAYGLPDPQQLQTWWGYHAFPYWGSGQYLEVRHLKQNLWGWWYDIEYLELSRDTVARVGGIAGQWVVRKQHLETGWDSDANHTFLEWYGTSGVRMTMFVLPSNVSWDIGQAWDQGELSFMISYEIDWNATNLNAWNILFQLLTFQSPNLGIPGIAGIIFDLILAIPIYICVGIAVIKLIQSMIPFIKGLHD